MTKGTLLMIGNYLNSPRHNQNVWHSLAQHLSDNGWAVITSSSRESQILRLMDMVLSILRHRAAIDVGQIDVFSGRAFFFAEVTAWLLSFIKKPVILTLHGGKLPQLAQSHPKRVQKLLQRARVVVTPSPFIQQSLAGLHSDIRFIPNPVELNNFVFRKRETFQPRLIWVRVFHQVYNPRLAVEVVNALKNEYPTIRLTMIGPDEGDGSQDATLTYIRDMGLSDFVQIIPGLPYSEIPKYLDQEDIFLNTSNFDSAPRCLIEAMACGLCVISTNVGGIPWMVKDQVDGLLVPPNDYNVMTEAIRTVLEHAELAQQLSVNGRRKAEIYNWPAILSLWEKLLREVISEPRNNHR